MSRGGPVISHLLFVDDSFLFCKATKEEVLEIKRIIHKYEQVSGQQVNMEKSSIMFSRNTDEELKKEISDLLREVQVVSQGEYLGLPMVITRAKNQVFRFIREKAAKKFQNWKGSFLRQAGKEVLLKSVVMALPNYTISYFRLPKGMCKELSKMMARFWWGSKEGEKKTHWVKWSKRTEPKCNVGLGIRDISCFNSVELAKQLWRFISHPNILDSLLHLRGDLSLVRRHDGCYKRKG
ncbi:hypothetical protein ACH5RR_003164 [Cinchona calisaya]|uniref:Reverse transcriptase n=1 Tax=Cinchona calisaya TaxID=153742 RepID=A0ABD3AU61_9GENT